MILKQHFLRNTYSDAIFGYLNILFITNVMYSFLDLLFGLSIEQIEINETFSSEIQIQKLKSACAQIYLILCHILNRFKIGLIEYHLPSDTFICYLVLQFSINAEMYFI